MHVMDHNKAVAAILLLYLAVGTNFLKELFTCELQYQLTNNLWLKHLLGIFVFYFAVVSPSILPGEDPVKQLAWSFGLYLLFLATTRCDYRVTLLLILAGIALVFSNNLKDYYAGQQRKLLIKDSSSNNKQQVQEEGAQNEKSIDKFTKVYTSILLVVTILGVLAYVGYKYMVLKKHTSSNFDWKSFLIGVPECSMGTVGQNLEMATSNLGTEIANGLKYLTTTTTKTPA